MHCRWRSGALTLSVVACLVSTALAQAPVGPELRVNTYTTGTQILQSSAVSPAGDFVLVWMTPDGGTGFAVAAQRFDASGARRGSEFVVSDVPPTNWTDVAADGSGGFTVVWPAGASPDVRARRYDANGVPSGPSFLVNTFTSGFQQHPAIAAAADGRFIVVWTSQGVDGSANGVAGQRFDASGARLGGEFVVNTSTQGYQGTADVAMDAAGNFVVVWTNQDIVQAAVIAAQRFTAAGARIGGEFVVNEPTTLYARSNARVAVAGDGSFVVVWQDHPLSVLARRFDAAGTPQGGNFVVSSFEAAGPVPRFTPDGRFVVAWMQGGIAGGSGDGSGRAIQARWFAADGSAGAPAFRVNASTLGDQHSVDLGSDGAGRVVAAWLSEHEEGQFVTNVFAQRHGLLEARALAVDTAPGPASDGNHVLDPGEAADLRPSWSNNAAAAQTLAGALTSLTGPPGATYVLNDAVGSYGSVPAGGTQACIDCYALSVAAPAGRPVQHWDATATEVINPGDDGHVTWTLHVGDSFSDVPRSSSFYRFVETLLHRGVTGGCGGESYCPGSSTTRAQMAPFLLVAQAGAGYAPRACFPQTVFADVPMDHPFCRWIEELARRGVTSGCGGGNYCPNDAVSREQMAVFVLRTLDPTLNPPACTTPIFNDVPASSPFCRWIEELARRGVVSGCGGGNYCPTAPVTREQMAVFLAGAFGLTLYGP